MIGMLQQLTSQLPVYKHLHAVLHPSVQLKNIAAEPLKQQPLQAIHLLSQMLQEDVILKPLLPTLIQLETNGPTPVEQARSLPLPLLSLLLFT